MKPRVLVLDEATGESHERFVVFVVLPLILTLAISDPTLVW